VASLAEVEVSLTGEMRLLNRYWFDRDSSSLKKDIALTAGIQPDLTLNDDGELNKIRGADPGVLGVVN